MGMTLLSATGAPAVSLTGNWVDIRSTVGKTYPHRILVAGTFNAGTVALDGAIGDNTIASNVFPLATGLTSGQLFTLDSPVDWIRAKTDSNIAGGNVLVLDSTTA